MQNSTNPKEASVTEQEDCARNSQVAASQVDAADPNGGLAVETSAQITNVADQGAGTNLADDIQNTGLETIAAIGISTADKPIESMSQAKDSNLGQGHQQISSGPI